LSDRREIPYQQVLEIMRRGAALKEAKQIDGKNIQSERSDSVLLAESNGLSTLDRAAKSLVPLRRFADVRADADLELGMIAICFAQHDDARRLLDEVLQSQPLPCQAYDAYFLRGRVDEGDGRIGDAERDYEAALQVAPHAQSAMTSLAALL